MLLTVTIRGLLNFNLFISVFLQKLILMQCLVGKGGAISIWPHLTVWGSLARDYF